MPDRYRRTYWKTKYQHFPRKFVFHNLNKIRGLLHMYHFLLNDTFVLAYTLNGPNSDELTKHLGTETDYTSRPVHRLVN